MPIHDWTRVDAGTFHDFHTAWNIEIRSALNKGLMPKGYYVQAEQRAASFVADVLALEISGHEDEASSFEPSYDPLDFDDDDSDSGAGVATAVEKVTCRTLAWNSRTTPNCTPTYGGRWWFGTSGATGW